MKNVRSSDENPFSLRPAQPGDLCILLESSDVEQAAHLRRIQERLQTRFGGTIITPVHLTSQRFTIPNKRHIDDFMCELKKDLQSVHPFPLTALGFQTLYVSVLQDRILKWRIEVTDALLHFDAMLKSVVASVGGESLYVPDAVSSLVTALHGVGQLSQEDLSPEDFFPHHLFNADILVLSRIDGPDQYTLMKTLYFS